MNRPEVFVFRPIKLVETRTEVRRTHLQIEFGSSGPFLLITSKLGEATHASAYNTEMHSLKLQFPQPLGSRLPYRVQLLVRVLLSIQAANNRPIGYIASTWGAFSTNRLREKPPARRGWPNRQQSLSKYPSADSLYVDFESRAASSNHCRYWSAFPPPYHG